MRRIGGVLLGFVLLTVTGTGCDLDDTRSPSSPSSPPSAPAPPPPAPQTPPKAQASGVQGTGQVHAVVVAIR